jgi:MYXO-CTERM domain-containing protein
MRIIWIVLLFVTGVAACVESEPWPEEEMDARNFPKESSGEFDPEPTPPPICGDNVINVVDGTLEQCDGVNLLEKTCEDFLYESGELRCGDDCTLNLSDCDGAICGNGYVDLGETCDINAYGPQLRMVCADDCGTLRCDESCNTTPRGECGDGIVQAPTEQCDGDAFHPVYLYRRRPEPYDLATLRCVDCRIDFSDAGPAICGNQLLERGEECEQDPWSDRVDDASGRRLCVDCRWEVDASFCGDGIVQSEWREQCEGELSSDVCFSDVPEDQQNRMPCVQCRPDYEFCDGEAEPDAGRPNQDVDAQDGPNVSRDAGGPEIDGSMPPEDVSQETDGNGSAAQSSRPDEQTGCAAGPTHSGESTTPSWLLALLFVVGVRRRRSRRTADGSGDNDAPLALSAATCPRRWSSCRGLDFQSQARGVSSCCGSLSLWWWPQLGPGSCVLRARSRYSIDRHRTSD